MSDETQHDDAVLPDEAVEDLAPEEAEQEVSGGSAFLKYTPGPGPEADMPTAVE